MGKWKEGRKEGRKERKIYLYYAEHVFPPLGRKERNEGKTKGRKDERKKEGMTGGRKDGRKKEGRTEGRAVGMKKRKFRMK